MAYDDQFSDDYAEEQRVLEEPERIKAFLSDLNITGVAEEVLEPEEVSDGVEVVATYELEHPYNGKDYSKALLHDEEVVASVQVEADVSETEEFDYSFTGTVRDNAYDIFHPPEVPGEGDVASGTEPQVEDSGANVETGKAMD